MEHAFVIMIRHWGITEVVLIANKLMVDVAAAPRPLLQTSVRDRSCICVSRDAATPMQRHEESDMTEPQLSCTTVASRPLQSRGVLPAALIAICTLRCKSYRC